MEYVFKQIGNEASINIEHIEKIWNCMVLNPLTPNDTDILLEWLQCGRIYRHVPFNFSLMSKVFSDFVANPEKNNFTNLSKIGYNTFRYFFVSINLFDNRINLKNLSISKRVHRDVIGLSQNFSIIFNANSDEVAKEAI